MDGVLGSGYWSVAPAEPLSGDMLLDAMAAVCGDRSPELRDEYRRRAVVSRADGFVRTLVEIRDL